MTVHGTKQISALVVDDEEDIRFLIRMVIRNAGEDMAVVGEAADGTEALDHIDAQDPDVVILDQRMPGLTGIETAREIMRRRPGQTIVLCSAYLDPELRREAEDAGIVVCIAKGEIKRIPQLLRELAGA